MAKAYTVNNFCEAFSISRSMFYKLCREGNGPETMKIGRRTIILSKSVDVWEKQMLELSKR